jgi:hypothetical protein
MAKLIAPQPKMRFTTGTGAPAYGWKLYTYAAGTTTPQATYTDATGATANTNPVILNARGEADVWLSNTAYKFVLKDSSDVTIWTVDSVTGQTDAATQYESIVIVIGDETTAITAGTAKVKFPMPYSMALTEVAGFVTTAQTSGSLLTFDVNKGNNSVLSTKITISNGDNLSTSATTQPVISDTSLPKWSIVSVDVDQVGNGTAKGPKIILNGYRQDDASATSVSYAVIGAWGKVVPVSYRRSRRRSWRRAIKAPAKI